MNAKQKKQVISIIKNDAEIPNLYMNSAGRTCVIGGLALSAKVSRRTLVMANSTDIRWGEHPGKGKVYTAVARIMKSIRNKFGLSCCEQETLQKINDSYNESEVCERRQALIRIVKGM